MKVKLKTTDASPAGVYAPGTVRDLPASEAEALIEGGFAEPVERATAADAPSKDPPKDPSKDPPSPPAKGGRRPQDA